MLCVKFSRVTTVVKLLFQVEQPFSGGLKTSQFAIWNQTMYIFNIAMENA